MIEIDIRKKLMASTSTMELNISTSISPGNLVAIYGPSGVGKTTLLRLMAGLTVPDNGSIKVNGLTWNDSTQKIYVKPQHREIGLVFQDYSLFPNLDVSGNLQFALGKLDTEGIIAELLDIMELTELADRKPDTLSGGQRQRVALALALVRKPKILLLDEALSALDSEMRYKLQEYILILHRKFQLTTLLVSHHIPEIYRMADRVLQMSSGQIVGDGTPDQLFGTQSLSGKYRTIGTILKIEQEEFIYVVSVLSGNQIIKVICSEREIQNICAGDEVAIVSKAFNPLIFKIEK